MSPCSFILSIQLFFLSGDDDDDDDDDDGPGGDDDDVSLLGFDYFSFLLIRGVQRAGFTTPPDSADYGIHLIFTEFYEALGAEFAKDIELLGGMPDPKLAWLRTTGFANDMEFEVSSHLVSSEKNPWRRALYWAAALFLRDMAWEVCQSAAS